MSTREDACQGRTLAEGDSFSWPSGLWCVGRLQTDADRERVVDGLAAAGSKVHEKEIESTIQRLAPRWFLMRDAHTGEGPVIVQPRWAMSFLRGPMTQSELRGALGARNGVAVSG
jgi:hypothetical protein